MRRSALNDTGDRDSGISDFEIQDDNVNIRVIKSEVIMRC